MMENPTEPVDDEELADLALSTAREAAALLIAGADSILPVATKSSPHDLVTQMDRDSEQLIRRRIAARRPLDIVLGEEEGTGSAPAPESPGSVKWIVDPVDGTVNYFYGIPSWAVSLAAEIDGQVRVGVVVAPALGEEYLGIAGIGSWLLHEGERLRLRVSGVSDLADAVVSTGFGYRQERRVHQGRVVAALLPEIRDIRRVGAAAVDLCWVARGRVDAHYERGLQDWDRAAGGLIASEAGATVAGLRGEPHSESMTVAANPQLFAALADRLAQLRADAGP